MTPEKQMELFVNTMGSMEINMSNLDVYVVERADNGYIVKVKGYSKRPSIFATWSSVVEYLIRDLKGSI